MGIIASWRDTDTAHSSSKPHQERWNYVSVVFPIHDAVSEADLYKKASRGLSKTWSILTIPT